jgi:type I restriction enzyme S subunit
MSRASFFITEGECEPAYTNLRDLSEVAHHRKFVENLWAIYAPYADDHFVTDARMHLQERFWEMYLGCTLIKNGFELFNPSRRGPEFYCQTDGARCWFEAITPGPGTGRDLVPEIEYNTTVATRVPEEQIILRLRHAIHEKYKKYEICLRDGDLTKKDAYVIAINSKRVRQPIPDSTPPYIIKAVFPVGPLAVSIDPRTREVVDRTYLHRDQIVKQSGNPVSTNVFLDERYAGISAVLYSSVDVANYPERLGADFRLVHNPLAQVPITRSSFAFGIEYWIEDGKLASANRNENTA